jgi:hypothetical protein
LFAGNTSTLDQQLAASASVGGGYDDNVLADALDQAAPNLGDFDTSHRGGVGTASAALEYMINRARFGASASGGTTTRYYPGLATKFIRRQYAAGGLTANIGKGLSAGAQGSYMPYSLASMFSPMASPRTGTVGFDEDLSASLEHYVAYSGNLGFNHQVSRRTTLNLDTSYDVREGSAQVARFTDWFAGGHVTHGLTRDMSLRLGYQYAQARYSRFADHTINHTLDVGIDYHHALSRSRRTNVSFSTGATAITTRLGNRAHLFAIGSAQLTHEMGRTWFTSLGYSRGVDFIASWPQPLFSDTVSLGLSGLITRRLQVQADAQAARGSSVLVVGDGDNFRTYYGNAGMSFALNRFLSTGVTYAYYNHRFAAALLLPPGFPHDVSRQSVRAYISVWAPIFERSRRQNGSR